MSDTPQAFCLFHPQAKMPILNRGYLFIYTQSSMKFAEHSHAAEGFIPFILILMTFPLVLSTEQIFLHSPTLLYSGMQCWKALLDYKNTTIAALLGYSITY